MTMTALAAATAPREPSARRLLRVDRRERTLRDERLDSLVELLDPGDLLVVNDAATLPASLRVRGQDVELRLAAHDPTSDAFRAIVFGSGDWRAPTETRPPPRRLHLHERLSFVGDLAGEIVAIDPVEPRLVSVRFDGSGAELYRALYRAGRLVQYAYLPRPLELWAAQSAFAGRPWAFEPPSAGLPLTFRLLLGLRARGVGVAWLTHAAGLSSTGEERLDRRLPFAERYEIPEETAATVERTRRHGGRVIAVGTTVVRALEASAAPSGGLRPGIGEAEILLGPRHRLLVTDGILTGLHQPGTSHFELLRAFVDEALLSAAIAFASDHGYLQHEFGDSCLIA